MVEEHDLEVLGWTFPGKQYLKSVIAWNPNGRTPPHVLVRLCGVLPHLYVLIQGIVLNNDVKLSVFCSNVMVEAQLQV